ncbi:MAG: helix-turn-helix transcriptional regulator [Peptostreptococcaceae bacterium]|nr:helix-turn-helix transcriptional regulator [Peptostreptococcaceae bacterium]
MESIGSRLKQARKASRLTMQQVHESTGLSKGNISNFENNKFKPSADALVLLSELYDVSIDWILKGEAFPQESSEQSIYPPEDKEMYAMYSQLTMENKLEIKGMIRLLLSKQNAKNETISSGSIFKDNAS